MSTSSPESSNRDGEENDEATRRALQSQRAASALKEDTSPREASLNMAPLRRAAIASTRGAGSIGPRWRSAARTIGIACFLLGAALLFYVFRQALAGFQNFSRPDYLSLQMRRVMGDGFGENVLAGIIVLGTEFMRLGYMLVLGFLGSIVMAKGIQFFAASESVIDEALEEAPL
jgi:hypothetical protein